MRVLLLYKNSAFENYFLSDPKRLKRLKGLYNSLNIKRFYQTHENHYQALKQVQDVIKSRGLSCHCVRRGQRTDYSDFSLIVTVGGDGTFLEAARHVKDQMVLGVNSDPLWSVGRFCVSDARRFKGLLDRLIAGKSKITFLQRMQIVFSGKQRVWTALNDCLISHSNPAAMSRYYIKQGRIREEHRSSGVWVATAAGSTGAIRSAGGKALPALSKNLQYRCRELYKGWKTEHKLPGGLIKPGEELVITSMMREGMIYIDGSHIHLPFGFGQSAAISLSQHPLKTIQGV